MNDARLELALRKQRLLLDAAALRADLARHGAGIAPLFATADRVVDGARWLRGHPQVVVAAAVAFAVARPRRALRWGQRLFLGWRTWRRLRGLLETAPRS